ncbi:hypothetical protein L218DRAFT_53628 [Marasmius fiardii PR-910]|nr:hypothetical protein L218DRAFT_53628 [Marasmius fiardii PR-910]
MSATIHDLPNEVLGKIFELCATFCADAPIILSAVGRRFKLVAYNTPRAWSKLRLTPEGGNVVHEKGLVRKTGLWFSKAGACSLHLFIDLTAVSELGARADGNAFKRIPLLTAVLGHQRSRIQALNLRSDTELKAYDFLDAIYKPFSSPSSTGIPRSLQDLRICIISDIPPVAPTTWSPVFDSFDRFPALQSLKLTNHVLPAIPTPNLSSLRSLVISRPLRAHPLPLNKLAILLKSAPVLERLDIESRIAKSHNANTPIDLKSLKTLALRGNNIPSVLSLLALGPVLGAIRVVDLDGRRPKAAIELGTALDLQTDEVLKNLRSLEISGVSFHLDTSENLWRTIICRMKDLRYLMLDDLYGSGGKTVVDILANKTETGDRVCSQLRYVSLTGSLLTVQGLRMERPEVTIEWETGNRSQPENSRVGRSRSAGSNDGIKGVDWVGVGGLRFGSPVDLSRQGSSQVKVKTGSGSLLLDDVDGTW